MGILGPGYARRLYRELDQDTADLVMFWLLRRPLTADRLIKILGSKTVDGLLASDIIDPTEDGFRAFLSLYPVRERHIFTDNRIDCLGEVHKFTVYYLGSDSYELVDTAPMEPYKRGLDLCTGSGVHAVLAGAAGGSMTGVDINPRALAISDMNARINGLADKVSFDTGNLYEAVPGKKFDRITANPPFIPTPDDMELFRGGGESGEQVTEQIFRGAGKCLREGGIMMVVTNYPRFQGVDLHEHCRNWLPSNRGWGILILERRRITAESYTVMQMGLSGDYEQDYEKMERWMKSYDRMGIVGVDFGTYFVMSLPEGDDWDALVSVEYQKPISPDTIQAFLKARSTFNVSSWLEQWESKRLTIRPGYELWKTPDGRGQARFEDRFWPAVDLEPSEVKILERLQQSTQPAGDLSENPDALQKLGGSLLVQHAQA